MGLLHQPMTDRIIDISENPSRLSIENQLLVIQSQGQPLYTVPVQDVAAIVISNPGVSLTHAVISALAQAGGMLISCDHKKIPAAMVLPLSGHFVQTERFAIQAAVKAPVKKRLWQEIIQAKIRSQATVLKQLGKSHTKLKLLATKVKSGDPKNIEAWAARLYWRSLFGAAFIRDATAIDQNRYLNYGYAVLRAIVARALCGVGLHPSFGIKHHNRYNAFSLADDLMEPFRPIVDLVVAAQLAKESTTSELTRVQKQIIINALLQRFQLVDEARTLFDIATKLASNLVAVMMGRQKKLMLSNLNVWPGITI